METITQKFYDATVIFYKLDEKDITLQDITTLTEKINKALVNGKYNCVSECTIDDGDTLYVSLSANGKPYYQEEDCEVEPYRPATMYDRWGDPGNPAEGGYIYCYSSTLEMLKDKLGNLPDWDYEVDEEDYDTEEELWEMVEARNEPDPDEEYERWRDERL